MPYVTNSAYWSNDKLIPCLELWNWFSSSWLVKKDSLVERAAIVAVKSIACDREDVLKWWFSKFRLWNGLFESKRAQMQFGFHGCAGTYKEWKKKFLANNKWEWNVSWAPVFPSKVRAGAITLGWRQSGVGQLSTNTSYPGQREHSRTLRWVTPCGHRALVFLEFLCTHTHVHRGIIQAVNNCQWFCELGPNTGTSLLAIVPLSWTLAFQ